MQIFVAASYSAKVDYETGKVFDEYAEWLENLLLQLEDMNYSVFCSLRDDKYLINNGDPAAAFRLDMAAIDRANVVLALLDAQVSAGVQLEIGYALALKKKVLLAHDPQAKLAYINTAAVQAGFAHELLLPLDETAVRAALA